MKYKRRCGATAICIGLILLSVLSAVLFMEVDSDVPTVKGATDARAN